jgi:hypothetical protein
LMKEPFLLATVLLHFRELANSSSYLNSNYSLTGSNGKTTTKELIQVVLSKKVAPWGTLIIILVFPIVIYIRNRNRVLLKWVLTHKRNWIMQYQSRLWLYN